MYHKTMTMLLCLILFGLLQAKTIHVPADKATIQWGIDAATNGDTVLVQPGTYVENINFEGKNIVVGSMYLITSDTSFISQTIIDGDGANVVAQFYLGEDTAAVLCGFTLTNGDGGIRCQDASPSLKGLIVKDNSCSYSFIYGGGHGAGGIFLGNSNAVLDDIVVKNNNAKGGYYDDMHAKGICIIDSDIKLTNAKIIDNYIDNEGAGHYCNLGGIYCQSSILNLSNVSIRNNSTNSSGGGISCSKSTILLENVSLTHNYANYYGGGIYCDFSTVIFNPEKRCTIYSNRASKGNDLFSNGAETCKVYADTFTVPKPLTHHAFPDTSFTFDILYGKLDQVNTDMYVNPAGDDTYNGLSPDKPLKTIRSAISRALPDSLNPVTIFCANGYYSSGSNGEIFPLVIPNYVSLKGESENKVILYARMAEDNDGQPAVLCFYQNKKSTIEKMTITSGENDTAITGDPPSCGILCDYNSNVKLVDVIIRENMNGIMCDFNSRLELINTKIRDNIRSGLLCNQSHVKISNGSIAHNGIENNNVGGIYSSESKLVIDNVTINNNNTLKDGGAIYCIDTNLEISNTIIKKNTAQYDGGGLYIKNSNSTLSNVTISENTAIYGGGIYFDNSSTIFDPENRCNIYLNKHSFSQVLGIDLYAYNCPLISVIVDTFSVLEPTALYAFPYYKFSFDVLHGFITSIPDEMNAVPLYYNLYGNYPNPFNPTTTIQYDLPRAVHVQLAIYDVLGQQVKRLVDQQNPAGQHKVTWDSTNDYGERVAAGLYFCRMESGEYTEVIKLALVR